MVVTCRPIGDWNETRTDQRFVRHSVEENTEEGIGEHPLKKCFKKNYEKNKIVENPREKIIPVEGWSP